MGYATLARTRQADRGLRPERDTLYELFYTINDLLKNVSGNGTLFVHAAYRIPAHAEYYLYRSRKAASNTVSETEIQQTLSILRKLIEAYRCEEGEEPLRPAQQTDLNERLARVESLLHSPESVRALQAYMRFLMDREAGTGI